MVRDQYASTANAVNVMSHANAMTPASSKTQSLIELVDGACNQFRDRPCFVFEDAPISYGEIHDLSCRVANGLLSAGIDKGMRGAVFSPNNPWGFAATIGIIRAGAIWVPINPRNSLDDNAALLSKFGCDVLFYHSALEAAVPAIRRAAPHIRLVVCIDKEGAHGPDLESWASGFPATVPKIDYLPTDIVSIPMTGGTTGLPKAVALSNRNFDAILKGVSGIQKTKDGKPPINLAAAPMTHVGGRIIFTIMYQGGTSVILPQIDPEAVIDAIETYKISHLFLPPTAVYALLDQPDLRERDLSSLRQFAYGSAPISIEKLKEALRVLGPVMAGGFGQTECPMLIASLPPEEHFIDGKIAPDERLSSVGRATPCSTLGIMDERGRLLPPGETGEIVVQGPMVMEGYFEDPEATAETRMGDWHKTGDIGRLDEEGYLYIVDRKKDMIITGGFNVYSAEVENAVSTMPGIRAVVVVGVPDDKWGEAVKAVVQLEDEASLDAETILAKSKEKLGGVKAPKSVDFVDDFPRSANGKILKREVRDRYWKEAGRQI